MLDFGAAGVDEPDVSDEGRSLQLCPLVPERRARLEEMHRGQSAKLLVDHEQRVRTHTTRSPQASSHPAPSCLPGPSAREIVVLPPSELDNLSFDFNGETEECDSRRSLKGLLERAGAGAGHAREGESEWSRRRHSCPGLRRRLAEVPAALER